MNKRRVGQLPRCGAMDSKYFGKQDQFYKDMQRHAEDVKQFKTDIRELIIADPGNMQDRLHMAIQALREVKAEFNL